MRFVPNQPIETRTPAVVVDAGLPVGSHVFRLEVVNARGQRSQPVEVTVTIVRLTPPIPPIIPIPPPTPIGRPPIG